MAARALLRARAAAAARLRRARAGEEAQGRLEEEADQQLNTRFSEAAARTGAYRERASASQRVHQAQAAAEDLCDANTIRIRIRYHLNSQQLGTWLAVVAAQQQRLASAAGARAARLRAREQAARGATCLCDDTAITASTRKGSKGLLGRSRRWLGRWRSGQFCVVLVVSRRGRCRRRAVVLGWCRCRCWRCWSRDWRRRHDRAALLSWSWGRRRLVFELGVSCALLGLLNRLQSAFTAARFLFGENGRRTNRDLNRAWHREERLQRREDLLVAICCSR